MDKQPQLDGTEEEEPVCYGCLTVPVVKPAAPHFALPRMFSRLDRRAIAATFTACMVIVLIGILALNVLDKLS